MATSTYLQLCQKTVRRCGIGNANSPAAVTGQTGLLQKIVEWVADADEEIQARFNDWNFLHTEFTDDTIVGVAEVSAPSDIGRWDVDSFYLDYTTDSYKRLKEMDYKEWRRKHRNGTKTNAQPGYFVIMPDHSITLESPPDAVYSLTADYWKTPTRLAANTNTSPIPSRYERAIIARAVMLFAEDQGATERLQLASVEYADQMNAMISAELPGQLNSRAGEGEPIIVRPE